MIQHLPKTAGIYQIVNTINQKRYIGCSNNVYIRCRTHIWELKRQEHGNDYLQYAWNKHGRHAFMYEILQECSEEKLFYWEDYWCKILQVHNEEYGYNIEPTDPNGKTRILAESTKKKMSERQIGRKLSVEWRENIGKVNKGKKMSPEAIQKTRIANTGKIVSEETKRRQSDVRKEYYKTHVNVNKGKPISESVRESLRKANTGRKHTLESRKKMGESHKGQKRSPEVEKRRAETFSKNRKAKRIAEGKAWKLSKVTKVHKCDNSGNVLDTYISLVEAAKANGCTHSAIGYACRGKIKKVKGFTWKREIIEEYEND